MIVACQNHDKHGVSWSAHRSRRNECFKRKFRVPRKLLCSRRLLLLGLHFDDFRCRLHALNVILIFGNELPPVNDLLPIPCMRNEHFFSQHNFPESQEHNKRISVTIYQTQQFPNIKAWLRILIISRVSLEDHFDKKFCFVVTWDYFFKDQQSTTSSMVFRIW